MSKKLALIIGFSLILVILLATCFHFLYTARSIGIGTAWDPSLQRWKVAAANRQTPLKTGDIIESVGGHSIGYLHFVENCGRVFSREEVFACLDSKGELYETLLGDEVPFTVTRDSQVTTVMVRPQAARLSFLRAIGISLIVPGLLCFIIGSVVLYKKGIDEQSGVLFFLCFCLCYVYVVFAVLSPEVVINARVEFLLLVGVLFLSVLGFAQMLHLSLLLPRKNDVLRRWPRLFWLVYPFVAAVCAIIIPRLVASLVMIIFVLIFATTIRAYLSCQDMIEKQQMKWIGVGYACAFLPVTILNILPQYLTGDPIVTSHQIGLLWFFIPLSMAFAIHRYRLMDIDDFLEGTLVYLATIGLLVGVDLSLMSLLATRLGEHLEIDTAGRVVISFAITISVYAAVREKIRSFLSRFLGRKPLRERDVVKEFTEAVSGHPPDAIARLLLNFIRRVFQPKALTLLVKGERGTDGFLDALKGKAEPTPLWQRSFEKFMVSEGMLLALPLGKGEEAEYALLLGQLPKQRFYSRHDMGILGSLLRQAKLLYENACLFDENLRYCRTILEEEKRHLAEKEEILRDLHDGVGGIMTNIGLLAAIAGRSMPEQEDGAPLRAISELSKEGLAEIRTFMHSLDSENLSWEGLIADLREFGVKAVEPNGMAFSLSSTLSDRKGRPGSLLCLNLFRVYKEALANVLKHSRASRVAVKVDILPERICLSVEDDGIGLAPSMEKKGRGISHMQRRAKAIGGVLAIASNKGTAVRLEVMRQTEACGELIAPKQTAE